MLLSANQYFLRALITVVALASPNIVQSRTIALPMAPSLSGLSAPDGSYPLA